MAITFGEARQLISKWAGAGGKSAAPTPETNLFVKEVLQYMLISGQYGTLKNFTFQACRGIFTVPYELEVPLKVKMGNEVGSAWDKWFDWYGYGEYGEGECLNANATIEDPNYYPMVYDLPKGGSHVGAVAVCEEDCDAHLYVMGQDLTGRDVYTTHKGETILGEYISIKKNIFNYSTVKYGKVTEIKKTKTNGYVQLNWYNPVTTERGFLSDYAPNEEKPQYRRFKILTRCPEHVRVSVLGKIRLKENYADNEFIPFDNLHLLSLAAQSIYYSNNTDAQNAQAAEARRDKVIEQENESKKPNNGVPIEVFGGTSGGSIPNITARHYGPTFRGWFGRGAR